MMQRLGSLKRNQSKFRLSSDFYNKLSWSIGTKVLVKQNAELNECTIIQISKSASIHTEDIITVQFKDGKMKTFQRYNEKIQSHPTYLKNRIKLSRYCTIEKYCNHSKRWISAYIDDWGHLTNFKRATNGQRFSVNGESYHRWSEKIRCSSALLKLGINSRIFVFAADIKQWCYGIITDMQTTDNVNQNNLNIFTVHYQKNGMIYLKYVHQFSCSIALMSDVTMTEHVHLWMQPTDIDTTDLAHYRWLLQDFVGKNDLFFDNDVISILIRYIGVLDELVIAIESRTWPQAIKHRELNLMPKDSSIHIDHTLLLQYCNSNEPPIPSCYNIPTTSLQKHNNTRFMTKGPTDLDVIDDKKSTGINSLSLDANLQTKLKTKLDANAVSFDPGARSMNNRQQPKDKSDKNNPYRSVPVQYIQKRIRIPHKLTNRISKYVGEKVSNVFHYMSSVHALQFTNDDAKGQIKIFNYNFHDKNTEDTLYGVAMRYNSRKYEWCMLDKLFLAQEICDGWNITTLPKPVNFIFNDEQKIKSIISDKRILKQIIKDTNWCKIKVYHRVNNKDRMVFKPTKEQFISKCVDFINKNNNDIKLIPILIINDDNRYLIDYLHILQVSKKGVLIDIGVSLRYERNRKYGVGVSGIHIDKEYILNQHELANPNCCCKHLNNFISIIDDINIGNPDCMLNKLRAAEQRIKKLMQNK